MTLHGPGRTWHESEQAHFNSWVDVHILNVMDCNNIAWSTTTLQPRHPALAAAPLADRLRIKARRRSERAVLLTTAPAPRCSANADAGCEADIEAGRSVPGVACQQHI